MNVSQAFTLPFISVKLVPEHAPELPVIFLLDSGAAVNCLNASLIQCSRLRILPTQTCPVGASGAVLGNKGDIFATIRFCSGKNYRDRFTLIEDLPFSGILGATLLQNNNFQMLRDRSFVMLGNVKVPRVPNPGIIATIKDNSGKFRCGAKALESPLSGTQVINPDEKEMGTCQENAQLGYGESPNESPNKPSLSAICPILHPGEEVIVRKFPWKKKTLVGHVGFASTADLYADLENKPNRKSLLPATNYLAKEHRSLRNILLNRNGVFGQHKDDLGCFVVKDGSPSCVNLEVRDLHQSK